MIKYVELKRCVYGKLKSLLFDSSIKFLCEREANFVVGSQEDTQLPKQHTLCYISPGISISRNHRKTCFYGWIPAISDFQVKTPFPCYSLRIDDSSTLSLIKQELNSKFKYATILTDCGFQQTAACLTK